MALEEAPLPITGRYGIVARLYNRSQTSPRPSRRVAPRGDLVKPELGGPLLVPMRGCTPATGGGGRRSGGWPFRTFRIFLSSGAWAQRAGLARC